MKKLICGIAGLAAGLGVASSSSAAPPAKAVAKPGVSAAHKHVPKVKAGWVEIKTVAFTHKLPTSWSQIEKVRRDFSEPTTGSWRYASANAHSKLFIRISTIKDGGIAGAFKRAVASLNKRVQGLKQLMLSELPAGPNKNPAGIAIFQGITAVRNRASKKIEGMHHVIIRYLKQYKAVNRQVSITYLFAAGKEDQVEKFTQQHVSSFNLHDPVEVTKMIIAAAKKDARPVKNPIKPKAADIKKAIKALGKDGHKLITAPSKAAVVGKVVEAKAKSGK